VKAVKSSGKHQELGVPRLGLKNLRKSDVVFPSPVPKKTDGSLGLDLVRSSPQLLTGDSG